MNIKNYHEAVDALRPRLSEYLQDQNIEVKGDKFRCINKDHEDKNPSMSIVHDGMVAHCFSCSATYNIFQAARVLEDRPASGPLFGETVAYLAEKFGVEIIEGTPMTEEQIYKLDIYRTYQAAANLIANCIPSEAFTNAIAERGWSIELCKELGIGCISDYNQFRTYLRGDGVSASFLDDIDLSRKDLFGDDRLIFTIKDRHGKPVGFSSRNLNYTEDKKNGSKYVNQRSTGVKCNIYQKSKRLYGFDRVLKKVDKKTPIYIFEGYSDVVTAINNKIDNCVAIGGTALTIEQIHLLKEHGYYNIILCLDGDTPGQDNIARLLDTVLGGQKDLKIRIVRPSAKMDPDSHIRQFSASAFLELKKWDAFEWRLDRFDDEDSETICAAMIPLIVNESNYVSQEKMCKNLAKETGVSLSSIQHELKRLQNDRAAEKSRERQLIIDKMLQSCSREPAVAEQIIHEAESKLFDLSKKYEEDSFSVDSTLSLVDTQKSLEEAKDGSFSGFVLGSNLKYLQDSLCGQWRKDVWFTFGGKPNCGKTSLLCKLLYEIAKHKENNACVIYHTIDDTAEQVLPKFVCVADGTKELTLNEVMDPNYHKNDTADEHKKNQIDSRRENGYVAVRELIKDGRLIIKDANAGISLSYADRLIQYYQERYPDRNLVYVLDNFHKLSDFTNARGDERVRFKDLSKEMKKLATKYHILVISTVEYRKTRDKARNEDISETIQIEYDASLIAHVHNELHEKGAGATLVHRAKNDNKRLPYIELELGKNKITDFKEKLYFQFYPSSSDFLGVSPLVAAKDANKEKELLKESTDEQRDIYRQQVQNCIEKGQKIGAAFYTCRDEHGFDAPMHWRKEFE